MVSDLKLDPPVGGPWEETTSDSPNPSNHHDGSTSPVLVHAEDGFEVENRSRGGGDDGDGRTTPRQTVPGSGVETRLTLTRTNTDRSSSEPRVSSGGFFFSSRQSLGRSSGGVAASASHSGTFSTESVTANLCSNHNHSVLLDQNHVDVNVGVKKFKQGSLTNGNQSISNSTSVYHEQPLIDIDVGDSLPDPLGVQAHTDTDKATTATSAANFTSSHKAVDRKQTSDRAQALPNSSRENSHHRSASDRIAPRFDLNSGIDQQAIKPQEQKQKQKQIQKRLEESRRSSTDLLFTVAATTTTTTTATTHSNTTSSDSPKEQISNTIVSPTPTTSIPVATEAAGDGSFYSSSTGVEATQSSPSVESNMGYTTNTNHPAGWTVVGSGPGSSNVNVNDNNAGSNSNSNSTTPTSNKMDAEAENLSDQWQSQSQSQSTARRDRDDDDDDSTLRSIDSHSLSLSLSHSQSHNDNNGDNATGSLAMQQQQHDQSHEEQTATGSHSVAGTPSTVSTAPSTDGEGSAYGMDPNAMERLALKMDAAYREGMRVPAWDTPPQHFASAPLPDMIEHAFSHTLPPAFSPQPQPALSSSAWGGSTGVSLGQGQQHQRVASFRSEMQHQEGQGDQHGMYAFPRMNPTGDGRWQQQQQQQQAQQQHQQQQQQAQARYADTQLPFLTGGPVDNRMFHQQPPNAYNPYQVQQQQQQQQLHQQQQQQHQRKPSGYAQALLPPSAATPPRGGRGQGQRLAQSPHHPHQTPPPTPGNPVGGSAGQSHGGAAAANPSSARSASEVLKTLLRKKACLYEPDTSRAVALVTWLVGKELAMEFGFFSRQQLQAGVHTCVADKIESGAITRTKVNRCMQIILNSCFHYIIPRPDGSEENGSSFRNVFVEEVRDDAFLLQVLPVPWNDIVVDRDAILEACAAEVEVKVAKKPSPANTPKNSPRMGPVDRGSPGGKDSLDGESGDHKRAVLLCFNENVRCAEDVFRCHNEFIRDTAHASHLQMSSQEWRLFFGQAAAGARFIWGNVGIPVPHSESRGGPMQTDALGMMTDDEVGKFRTCWCTKRYDHSRDLCGFAHAEMNGGWLRRNPSILMYRTDMCPFVSNVADQRIGASVFVLNECPHGVSCEYAHSMEEIIYHPNNYKVKPCSSLARPGGCNLGDVCPHFHPADSYRFSKKSDGRGYGARHSKSPHHGVGGKGGLAALPAGSPILYASPAPVSSFEQHFALPGLQNLFRRHCSVVRAHLRAPGGSSCTCCYSYFGDDSGVNIDPLTNRPNPVVGLPQPIRT